MNRHIVTSLLVGAAVMLGTGLHAQQTSPPNLDAIPDKMPFSNPYGPPISAARAQSLIAGRGRRSDQERLAGGHRGL